MAGRTATAWGSEPLTRNLRRESSSSEEQKPVAFMAAHIAAGDHPAPRRRSAHPLLGPELRALLHTGGFFGIEDDSSLAQWNSDPDCSAHNRNRRINLCCASKNKAVPA